MTAPIKPLRFMMAWIIAGIVVIPAAAALAATAIVAIQTAVSKFVDTSPRDYWDDHIFFIIGIALLIAGFCIGILQKGIVRKHFGIELRRLSLFTALGALLAGIVAFQLPPLPFRFDGTGGCCEVYHLMSTFNYAVQIACFLGVLSAVQVLALRPYLGGAWRWIVAHVAAIAVDTAIVVALRLISPTFYDHLVIHTLLVIPIVSLFTGLTMLRLFRDHLKADKVKSGVLAAQPVPATDDLPAKPSVWDDAR